MPRRQRTSKEAKDFKIDTELSGDMYGKDHITIGTKLMHIVLYKFH